MRAGLLLLLSGLLLIAACAESSARGGQSAAGTGAAPPPTAPSAAAPTAAEPPPTETVRASWVQAILASPLYIGVDRGYWQEQGIELQLEQVQSAADAIAFLATGQLDASFGAIAVPLYNAVNQGLDVRVIAPVSYDRPGHRAPVLVRKALWDSGAVRSVADLRGRRVYTVAPGSGASYQRYLILDKARLKPDDVESVSLQLPDAPLAMANGQIDAGSFPDPWATRMLLEGTVVPVDPGPMPNVFGTAIMAGDRLRREHVEVGRRFMLGYLKAVRDLQTDEQLYSEATLETLGRWTGLKPEVIRELRFLPRWDPNLAVDVDNLLDQQRVHIAAGATTYTDPLPASRLVDLSLADYALQQLGRQ
jgi:NitT/TauT family transport system substrate-binding protein